VTIIRQYLATLATRKTRKHEWNPKLALVAGCSKVWKTLYKFKRKGFLYQILDPQKKLAHVVLVFSSTGCSQLFNAARCLFAQSSFGSANRRKLEPKDAQPQKHPQNLWFWEEHGLVGGLNPTPLKNDGVKVSWDYELPNILFFPIYGKIKKKTCSNHQPAGCSPLYKCQKALIGTSGTSLCCKEFPSTASHQSTPWPVDNTGRVAKLTQRWPRMSQVCKVCKGLFTNNYRIYILLWLITHLPSGKLT